MRMGEWGDNMVNGIVDGPRKSEITWSELIIIIDYPGQKTDDEIVEQEEEGSRPSTGENSITSTYDCDVFQVTPKTTSSGHRKEE